MRWIAVLLFLAGVGVLIWLGSRSEAPPLTVSIGPSVARPDPGDSNVLGQRGWWISPRVTIRARRNCEAVPIQSEAHALLNGRPFPRGRHAGGGSADIGPLRAGSVHSYVEAALADAGDTVRLTVTARCGRRDARAHRDFPLPTESCFGGPLHTYEVRGQVLLTNDSYLSRPVPLGAGDLIPPGSELEIATGGGASIGATECNDLRLVLAHGSYMTGSYDVDGGADVFLGPGGRVVGDAHLGGFDVAGMAFVRPIGRACRQCSPPVASFEARRQGGRRVRIRVYRGTVEVTRSYRAGPVLRVRAGEQVDAVCSGPQRCRLTAARLWQPDEPWSTPSSYRDPSLPQQLVTAADGRPARSALAPARARILRFQDLSGSRAAPRQLVLHWVRDTRTGAGRSAGSPVEAQGILVWQRALAGGRAVWRRVLSQRYAYRLSVAFDTSDITGDGHADLIARGTQGSGGCGPTDVYVTVKARIEHVFHRDECESQFTLGDGALQIYEPVGPCPSKQGSAHCSGGTAHVVERWNGRRLVVVRRSVRCLLPRLDPATGCRRNRG